MRLIGGVRSLRFTLAAALMALAAPLSAQTQASPWQSFGTAADGFRAQFPSQPEVTKSSVPVGGETYELHSYVTEVGATALYVGVCDYGPKGAQAVPEEMLTSAKKGAVEHMNAHLLSEDKIALTGNPGVEFEAESDRLHFTVRMYMAGGVLYQTMVASPLNEKFADGTRFLDSFELLPRPHAAASGMEWKSYSYPSDGFSAAFPSEPKVQKQNISTDSGAFELRTYVAEDSSTALIAAVCDYGAGSAGKDPQSLLEAAKKGAIQNLKAQLADEKKIALGSNPGVEFEANSESAHITARIYLAGTVLYQTIVASPLNAKYAESDRFLGSFQLLPAKKEH